MEPPDAIRGDGYKAESDSAAANPMTTRVPVKAPSSLNESGSIVSATMDSNAPAERLDEGPSLALIWIEYQVSEPGRRG